MTVQETRNTHAQSLLVFLSVCLSMNQPVYLAICRSAYTSIYLVYLSVYLYSVCHSKVFWWLRLVDGPWITEVPLLLSWLQSAGNLQVLPVSSALRSARVVVWTDIGHSNEPAGAGTLRIDGIPSTSGVGPTPSVTWACLRGPRLLQRLRAALSDPLQRATALLGISGFARITRSSGHTRAFDFPLCGSKMLPAQLGKYVCW